MTRHAMEVIDCQHSGMILERFRRYSPFIQQLFVDGNGDKRDLRSFIFILTEPLPNLKDLRLIATPELTTTNLEPLLSPSLRRMVIETSLPMFSRKGSKEVNESIVGLLHVLQVKQLGVNDLSLLLGTAVPVPEMIEHLSGCPFKRFNFRSDAMNTYNAGWSIA
ncbi:hypothetical protein FRB99_001586 [Tulasnella sp. 403]|nr:hypothetical protein FRB99_001586 [Tulasnella sp. 403]